MKIGFIGASKVGCSLGKYFTEYNSLCISGYYSNNQTSAKDASEFTKTTHFKTIAEVVLNSDIIFVTVSDSYIKKMWDEIKKVKFENKIFCHCSGALSSKIFDDVEKYKSQRCSIHPMLAINSKYESYHALKDAFFTIEGDSIEVFKEIFKNNNTGVIDDCQKSKYHASAVFASNHVLAVINIATKLIEQCGFSKEQAKNALNPIISNNINNYLEKGVEKALTGPVARNDVQTIKKHLDTLCGNQLEIYKLLTKELIEIPNHNFTQMKNELEG